MIRYVSASALAAVAFAALAGSALADTTFLDKSQDHEFLAHRLVGTRVLNGQAEDIGEVKDVIVNTQGTATGFVIGVGGFLGLGDKLVAVPFSSVEVGDVIAGSRVIVVPVTKEQLKAAPTYTSTDPTMADRAKQKASDWLASVKSKAIELAKQASEKAKELSDKASEKAKELAAPKDAAPAPKQ